MNEIIPAMLFLILCFTTFFLSKYWIKKYDSTKKIESISNENKMSYERIINIHAKNVKIGSVILIIITFLKIIHIFLTK